MSREIEKLKGIAAHYYKRYFEEVQDYTCGRAVAEYINPNAAHNKRMFNETMDKLAQLDPDNCPKERL